MLKMKRMAIVAAFAIAIGGIAVPASVAAVPATTQVAHIQTAKFAIANMTCATCPISVKTAMEKVPGVRSVKVSFEAKTATVVFDPSRVKLSMIAAASTQVGYPATLVR